MADRPCVVCGNQVKRGERYVGEKFKTEKFCSESCYNKYLELKSLQPSNEKYPGWTKLLDYINQLYPPDSINWPVMTKQIVKIIKDYGLTCDNILNIIRYAIVYEKYTIDNHYYLGQFIPKYIEPYRNFVQAVKQSRIDSKFIREEEVYFIKSNKQNGNIYRGGKDEIYTLFLNEGT